MNKIFLFLLILVWAGIFNTIFAQTPAVEVRAVWLTTNYGLDWPHNKNNHEKQKQELINLLDSLQKYNFNTVLFQTRGRGEVLYKSNIEPMSSLIVTPKVQSTLFDPLSFVIEETHRRGMECHAWFVTYPLGNDNHVKSLNKNTVTQKNPSITKKFKGEWFLDPGNPATDEYLLSLIKEIVVNYDIDGIHFDYIRYPDNKGMFPDNDTYKKFGKGKKKDDWRRDNITRFVGKTYALVKKEKPWVQVSSSPLGRYRALGNVGQGWTALETVYQDAAKWMQIGIHDALYPMMYYKDHLFFPFVDDWIQQCNNRLVIPGLGAYQMIEMGWSLNDLTKQMTYTREKETQGQAYFRAENVLSNTKSILSHLREYYKLPAKLPPLTWLSNNIPPRPLDLRAEKQDNGSFRLEWEKPQGIERITFNVYRCDTEKFDTNNAENLLAVGLKNSFFEYNPEENDKGYYYFITVSDSYRNESNMSLPAFFYHSNTVK